MKTLILPLTAAASVLAACGGHEAYEKPLTPVRVETVQPYRESGGVRYSASIEPQMRVDLAFRVPGYVESLGQVNGRPVQEGDLITKGTVLARLRESDYEQKVEQARSQLREAQAGATQAKAAFDRAQSLFNTQSLARPDYEAAKGAYEMTQAKVSGASALVREAQLALGDSALKSPIDGVVVKKLTDVGALVGPGTPGFILADTTKVKVVFGATDTLLNELKMGSQQRVTTEAHAGREFRGQITRIAPLADLRSRVFDVEVSIPNPDRALKLGMVAALRVAGLAASDTQAAYVVVPLTAVVRAKDNPDAYAVYVAEDAAGEGPVKGSTRVRLRPVSLGEAIGNRIAVTSGLAPGDRIVVTGATLVVDGEPVRILP